MIIQIKFFLQRGGINLFTKIIQIKFFLQRGGINDHTN